MPSANEKVKFKVCLASLARAYFFVSGYSSGDAYFSTKSRTMNIQTIKPRENSMLLMYLLMLKAWLPPVTKLQ
jgi:hypothetical protein